MRLVPWALGWLLAVLWLALDGRRRLVAWGAVLLLGLLLASDLALLAQLSLSDASALELTTGGFPEGIGIRLHVGVLQAYFGALCSAVLLAAMVHELGRGVCARLFPGLVLMLSSALHGAFYTRDLFNFYAFFELAMASSFALAYAGQHASEVRGAFVYVAINILGSVLFLMGVAATYHAAGTLDFAQLAERLERGRHSETFVPAALMFTALSLKLGLFPFHGWVPVIYTHARPAVAAMMAGALTNLGAYGLLSLGMALFPHARETAAPVLLVLGATATLYGSLVAFQRERAADVAAYAAIVHAGYLVLALGIGGREGTLALLLIALSGSLDKSAMFLSLEARSARRGGISLVAACSLAGLPLTIGFISKVTVFEAALRMGPVPSTLLSCSLVISGTLLAATAMHFYRLSRGAAPCVGEASSAPALALAVLIAGLAIMPEPVGLLAMQAATALLGAEP